MLSCVSLLLSLLIYGFTAEALSTATSCSNALSPIGKGFHAKFYRYPHLSLSGYIDDEFMIDGYRKRGEYQGAVDGVTDINFSVSPGIFSSQGIVYGFRTDVRDFALELTGFFQATQSGTYTFVLSGNDDGLALQIGASTSSCCNSFDSIITSEMTTNYAVFFRSEYSVELQAGNYYPIKLVYFNAFLFGRLNIDVYRPDGSANDGIFDNVYRFAIPSCDSLTSSTSTTPPTPVLSGGLGLVGENTPSMTLKQTASSSSTLSSSSSLVSSASQFPPSLGSSQLSTLTSTLLKSGPVSSSLGSTSSYTQPVSSSGGQAGSSKSPALPYSTVSVSSTTVSSSYQVQTSVRFAVDSSISGQNSQDSVSSSYSKSGSTFSSSRGSLTLPLSPPTANSVVSSSFPQTSSATSVPYTSGASTQSRSSLVLPSSSSASAISSILGSSPVSSDVSASTFLLPSWTSLSTRSAYESKVLPVSSDRFSSTPGFDSKSHSESSKRSETSSLSSTISPSSSLFSSFSSELVHSSAYVAPVRSDSAASAWWLSSDSAKSTRSPRLASTSAAISQSTAYESTRPFTASALVSSSILSVNFSSRQGSTGGGSLAPSTYAYQSRQGSSSHNVEISSERLASSVKSSGASSQSSAPHATTASSLAPSGSSLISRSTAASHHTDITASGSPQTVRVTKSSNMNTASRRGTHLSSRTREFSTPVSSQVTPLMHSSQRAQVLSRSSSRVTNFQVSSSSVLSATSSVKSSKASSHSSAPHVTTPTSLTPAGSSLISRSTAASHHTDITASGSPQTVRVTKSSNKNTASRRGTHSSSRTRGFSTLLPIQATPITHLSQKAKVQSYSISRIQSSQISTVLTASNPVLSAQHVNSSSSRAYTVTTGRSRVTSARSTSVLEADPDAGRAEPVFSSPMPHASGPWYSFSSMSMVELSPSSSVPPRASSQQESVTAMHFSSALRKSSSRPSSAQTSQSLSVSRSLHTAPELTRSHASAKSIFTSRYLPQLSSTGLDSGSSFRSGIVSTARNNSSMVSTSSSPIHQSASSLSSYPGSVASSTKQSGSSHRSLSGDAYASTHYSLSAARSPIHHVRSASESIALSHLESSASESTSLLSSKAAISTIQSTIRSASVATTQHGSPSLGRHSTSFKADSLPSSRADFAATISPSRHSRITSSGASGNPGTMVDASGENHSSERSPTGSLSTEQYSKSKRVSADMSNSAFFVSANSSLHLAAASSVNKGTGLARSPSVASSQHSTLSFELRPTSLYNTFHVSSSAGPASRPSSHPEQDLNHFFSRTLSSAVSSPSSLSQKLHPASSVNSQTAYSTKSQGPESLLTSHSRLKSVSTEYKSSISSISIDFSKSHLSAKPDSAAPIIIATRPNSASSHAPASLRMETSLRSSRNTLPSSDHKSTVNHRASSSAFGSNSRFISVPLLSSATSLSSVPSKSNILVPTELPSAKGSLTRGSSFVSRTIGSSRLSDSSSRLLQSTAQTPPVPSSTNLDPATAGASSISSARIPTLEVSYGASAVHVSTKQTQTGPMMPYTSIGNTRSSATSHGSSALSALTSQGRVGSTKSFSLKPSSLTGMFISSSGKVESRQGPATFYGQSSSLQSPFPLSTPSATVSTSPQVSHSLHYSTDPRSFAKSSGFSRAMLMTPTRYRNTSTPDAETSIIPPTPVYTALTSQLDSNDVGDSPSSLLDAYQSDSGATAKGANENSQSVRSIPSAQISSLDLASMSSKNTMTRSTLTPEATTFPDSKVSDRPSISEIPSTRLESISAGFATSSESSSLAPATVAATVTSASSFSLTRVSSVTKDTELPRSHSTSNTEAGAVAHTDSEGVKGVGSIVGDKPETSIIVSSGGMQASVDAVVTRVSNSGASLLSTNSSKFRYGAMSRTTPTVTPSSGMNEDPSQTSSLAAVRETPSSSKRAIVMTELTGDSISIPTGLGIMHTSGLDVLTQAKSSNNEASSLSVSVSSSTTRPHTEDATSPSTHTTIVHVPEAQPTLNEELGFGSVSSGASAEAPTADPQYGIDSDAINGNESPRPTLSSVETTQDASSSSVGGAEQLPSVPETTDSMTQAPNGASRPTAASTQSRNYQSEMTPANSGTSTLTITTAHQDPSQTSSTASEVVLAEPITSNTLDHSVRASRTKLSLLASAVSPNSPTGATEMRGISSHDSGDSIESTREPAKETSPSNEYGSPYATRDSLKSSSGPSSRNPGAAGSILVLENRAVRLNRVSSGCLLLAVALITL